MIIIRLKGGLGNQLFQYAFGRLLSIKKNVQVKYEFINPKDDTQREYKLGHFNAVVEMPTQEEIKKTSGGFSKLINFVEKRVLRQYNIGYVPNLLNKKDGYLEGYWQSYRYLEPIKKELLWEITLKKPIDQKLREIVDKINQTNSVSVHIRRGDYVNDPKTKAEHYTFGLEYYKEAFKIIRTKVQNPTLFVFSDDIEWVKENLKSDLPTVFVPNDPDYESFFTATYCEHNIIANSSFSFWIAWLNKNPDKIVIAPKKWNNKYQDKYKDLLPPEWIKI